MDVKITFGKDTNSTKNPKHSQKNVFFTLFTTKT